MSNNHELKNIEGKLFVNHVKSISVDFKVIALTGLLMEKGIITVEEVEESYKNIIKITKEKSVEYGIDSDKFEKMMNDLLLED